MQIVSNLFHIRGFLKFHVSPILIKYFIINTPSFCLSLKGKMPPLLKIEQTGGNIDYFATGIGTGGTILGVGKRLKEYNDKIKIIAVVPDSEMHGIEGWKYNYSLNFKGFDANKIIDDFVKVDTEGSYGMLQRLIREEGILCGFSSGANVYGIKKLTEKYKGNFATVLPNTGSRYLSTRVFSEI